MADGLVRWLVMAWSTAEFGGATAARLVV